jgi:hypothetical protein
MNTPKNDPLTGKKTPGGAGTHIGGTQNMYSVVTSVLTMLTQCWLVQYIKFLIRHFGMGFRSGVPGQGVGKRQGRACEETREARFALARSRGRIRLQARVAPLPWVDKGHSGA